MFVHSDIVVLGKGSDEDKSGELGIGSGTRKLKLQIGEQLVIKTAEMDYKAALKTSVQIKSRDQNSGASI